MGRKASNWLSKDLFLGIKNSFSPDVTCMNSY